MDIDLCWIDWHDTGHLVAVCDLTLKDNVMSEQGLTELTVRHQYHSCIFLKLHHCCHVTACVALTLNITECC